MRLRALRPIRLTTAEAASIVSALAGPSCRARRTGSRMYRPSAKLLQRWHCRSWGSLPTWPTRPCSFLRTPSPAISPARRLSLQAGWRVDYFGPQGKHRRVPEDLEKLLDLLTVLIERSHNRINVNQS